jgi:hypothetical protein
MSKIVKLKQSDISKIVSNIIKEEGNSWAMDDMNLGGPEEQPGFSDYEDQQDLEPEDNDQEGNDQEDNEGGNDVRLAKDPDGNYYTIPYGADGKPDLTKIGKLVNSKK